MIISKKIFLVTFVASCLLSFSFGYIINEQSFNVHRDPKVRANLFVFYETAKGSWGGQSGNIITDIGERYIRNIMGFDNVTANNATKWIGLGNSTISASKTKLDTEAVSLGFERTLGTVTTWMNGTDYAYNVTNKFTASGTIRINASSLHYNPTENSDNNCFALATDATLPVTFGANDNATFVWVITWDAN